MGKTVNISDIKLNFPDEWVSLGNPVMDDSNLNVLGGIPIYHSKDKKEVCYLGKDKTGGFDKITLIYTGDFKQSRKITSVFNKIMSRQAGFSRAKFSISSDFNAPPDDFKEYM